MVLTKLEELKDCAVSMLNDSAFLSAFSAGEFWGDNELWSKGPANSIVPFELEMSGVTPSKMTSKEPLNKKNAYRYYCDGKKVNRVDVYNAKGEVHEVERFIYRGERVYVLSTNRHAENLWLKIAEREPDGTVLRACRVDQDAEFWSFAYEWHDGALKEVTSFSYNSVPGVKIYPEYSQSQEMVGMYFLNAGSKVYVYKL